MDEFPQDLLLDEVQSQFDTATDRKLPLAYGMAHCGDVRIDFLLSQAPTSTPDELDNFVDALGHARQDALEAINSMASPVSEPNETSLRQKARLAMLSLHLGDPRLATEMCQLRSDPIQRTVFIDECSSWHGDLTRLINVASDTIEAPLRSALCLAVGSVPRERITSEQRDAWQLLLADWHGHQPDSGTHSASGWALRNWELPIPKLPVGEPERSEEQQRQIARMTYRVDDLRRQALEADQKTSNLRSGLKLDTITIFKGDQACLDPSGNAVVFNAAFVEREKPIMLRDLKTSEDRVLHEFAWRPTISPAGNKLVAMVSNEPSADDREVMLFDPDNQSVRSLGQGLYPTWSMDGTTVFFHHYASQTVMQIDVTEAASTPEALIDNIPSRYPAVAPDATKVAYFARGEIRVLDISTRTIIAKHVTNGWHAAQLSWAPDSRYVGFGSFAGRDARGLWLLDAETGNCFMVVPGNATQPSWSRDGSRLLYEDRTKHEIHVVQWPAEKLQSLADEAARRHELQTQLKKANAQLNESIFLKRQWRTTRVGLTMLRIKTTQDLNQKDSIVQVAEDFLLSDREISAGLFQHFVDDPDYPAAEKPKDWRGVSKGVSPTAEHPAQKTSWYDAVMFCNWLSLQEGLMPCYERTGKKEKSAQGMEYDGLGWPCGR